jgi:hypothetical protein
VRGISSTGKEKIKELIEQLFDRISAKLLGKIPALRNKKNIFFSANDKGLANLFLQSLGNRNPNSIEQDVIKGLLSSSYGYLEALKHNTTSNVVEQVDGLIKQSAISGEIVNQEQIEKAIKEHLEKARNNLKNITESEGTKVRNVGSATDIARVSAEKGIEDPNVFFNVIRDKFTCKYCIENHLHKDGTPKVFKLSEIKHGFLSTAEKKNGECSICGQHTGCRCSLQYLSPGYGFKNGKLSFISLNHDEWKKQRS